MKIEVKEETRIRRASARIQEAGVIHVKVPRHWSRSVKEEVIAELVARIRDKDRRQQKLLERAERQPRITLADEAALIRYVRQINAETFNAPLGNIKIGNAKYNHLAQVNLKTGTMTVSRYCLHNAPADALRYLIVHELAHYLEAGHNKRFWGLVGQFVPDYRLQSRIIKAFHHHAVVHDTAGEQDAILPAGGDLPAAKENGPPKRPGFFEQLRLWGL